MCLSRPEVIHFQRDHNADKWEVCDTCQLYHNVQCSREASVQDSDYNDEYMKAGQQLKSI
jgi:hypothetical protein